ncbi:hypothetical protein [Bifidobacterium aquikefiri]|uniref:hypothetical protein n=1 Tax=Bifidobacterium aquikefiri TaxID=1653207 RepID=UPI000416CA37
MQWEDAVAEDGDLLAVGQFAVLGVGDPSLGQSHEPFDEGRRWAWAFGLVQERGCWGLSSGDALPAGDG